ncbi:MAG: hypothetical protein HY919_03125, partial [Elusimicrobia bacterium]|nr:hypothetical protein [Elusimicrobiota bacterium]
MPARIIFVSLIYINRYNSIICDNIDEIFTYPMNIGWVFCLYNLFGRVRKFSKFFGGSFGRHASALFVNISRPRSATTNIKNFRAGMDVLQSFFGGRLLSEPISRPFSLNTTVKNILNGKKWAGTEVLSSGEERCSSEVTSQLLSAVRPFVSILRVGTKVLNFFGGRNAASTHPLTDFRAGTDVLKAVAYNATATKFFGGRYFGWLRALPGLVAAGSPCQNVARKPRN